MFKWLKMCISKDWTAILITAEREILNTLNFTFGDIIPDENITIIISSEIFLLKQL